MAGRVLAPDVRVLVALFFYGVENKGFNLWICSPPVLAAHLNYLVFALFQIICVSAM